MTNNDILRRVRYTFDYNDDKMIALFGLGGVEVTRADVSDWLKKEEAESYKNLPDKQLAVFLNGLIIDKRGKKDGVTPVPEKKLDNNIILRKLKIAFNMKDVDMLATLAKADFKMSKPELNAFFRKPDHRHYRKCMDQVIRNFLHGLQLQHRKN